MARCLIVACGCRGRALAAGLRADGHAVRGTTRRASEADALEAAGIEPHIGDPDRVATIAPALDHAVVVHLLLGSATGEPEALRALHGTRLDMLLSRMLDSTVRGIVYEAAGTVPEETLAGGADTRQRRVRGLEDPVRAAAHPAGRPRRLAPGGAQRDPGPPELTPSPSHGSRRSNRSPRILAVAPQMRVSPTT